jgi:hypothetical protein
MECYVYNTPSNYEEDNGLLSKSDIEEIASELSREITEEINKQFSTISKSKK